MIEWDSIAATLERGERKARRKNSSPPRAPDTKKQAKTSPYLVPLWKAEKVKRKGKGGKQLSKKARKYLRKLRPPDYLRKIPFEYDRIGRPTKRVSLLKDETARNHYNVYTSEYNFAFNSSCVFEVGIPGRQFKFYGIAFDFYQMKHHLLHDLLPNGDAPCKIQNMFRDVGHDLDRLVIQELQVCTPFIVKQHRGKVPMPFDQFVVALKHRRNGWALRHVLWLVRDIRILEMWMGRWKAQHTLAQEAYMRRLNAAALKIQLAWRKKNGQMVLHMKRRIKAEHEEMERAAIMIQNAWRRRDAKKMVSNMKKRMMEEEAEMEAAALTIQLAWRRKKGQLVLHMKRRIKAEEEEQTRAAIMIQNAWRRRDAKKMVANMKKRMMDEEAEMEAAALTIQLAWRRKKGQMVLHMKRRMKALEEEQRQKEINSCFFLQFVYRKNRGLLHRHMRRIAERFKREWMEELTTAALYIQYMYRRSKNLVPMHLKRMARKFAEEERKKLEQSAILIQYIWRKQRGMLAQHLIRQAKKRVQKRKRRRNDKMLFDGTPWKPNHWADMLTNIVGDDVFENLDMEEEPSMPMASPSQYDTNLWEACWDATYSRTYFYNRVTGESQWEEPSWEGNPVVS
jgi:hypothetical protein